MRRCSVTTSRRVLEVTLVFARLGVTSFSGPIAHLGYLQREFVDRKRWLTVSAFADLIALCQFLPGPASSRAVFAIGLQRAGMAGASPRRSRSSRWQPLMIAALGADSRKSSRWSAGVDPRPQTRRGRCRRLLRCGPWLVV